MKIGIEHLGSAGDEQICQVAGYQDALAPSVRVVIRLQNRFKSWDGETAPLSTVRNTVLGLATELARRFVGDAYSEMRSI